MVPINSFIPLAVDAVARSQVGLFNLTCRAGRGHTYTYTVHTRIVFQDFPVNP